jgi:hypothetical protein
VAAKVRVKHDAPTEFNVKLHADPEIGKELGGLACSLRYRLLLLKNYFWSLIRVKSGDQKCLEIREDRLYGILAQSNFCWFGRVRVFQQPRLITTAIRQPTPVCRKVFE